jgi:ribosomal protein S18 acetylase RimI-like enzyme
MSLEIRPFHMSDLSSLYRICLLTGNSGTDASELFSDPDLIGHFYAAPYAVLEPELCFVLVNSGSPRGYILGTHNSETFYHRCEKEWFPSLRTRHPLSPAADSLLEQRIIQLIHEGHKPNDDLKLYPAHLHIDLLPETQGMGMGRKMIEIFNSKLVELDIPAVHLQVGKKNEGAVQFYERVGFQRIKEYEHSIAFGMKLI